MKQTANKTISVALAVALVAMLIVVLLPQPAYADPGWYDADWQYRRTITLSSATSVANYQVKVTLTIAIMGNPYSNVNADGLDIRFTGLDGTTLQDYWIESWSNTGDSTIWVEVATSGTSTIYMYYGNAGASSASNGDDTFDFFDDFPGTSLDATTKWTLDSGTITVADSIATIEGFAYCQSTFGVNYVQETRARTSPNGGHLCSYWNGELEDHRIETWSALTDTTKQVYLETDDGTEGYTTTYFDWDWSVYDRYTLIRAGTTSIKLYVNGALKATNTTHISNLALTPILRRWDPACTAYYDFVFIRKYTDPEPSASVGSASAAPPAFLKSLQSGTVTIAADASSGTASITAVDMSKTILFTSLRENEGTPDLGSVRTRLSAADTITAVRNGSTGGGEIVIQYYVAEFSSGVFVQRGSTTLASSGTTTDVTLGTAVNLSKSFVVLGGMSRSGSVFSQDDFHTAKLTSATNLQFELVECAGGIVDWQVVQFNGASVQRGSTTFGAATYVEQAITSVDLTKSFLLFSTRQADGSSTNIGEDVVQGAIKDATTLRFEKEATTVTQTIEWEVIELPGRTVQHNTQSFTSSETSKDVTITSVDTTRSVAFASSQQLLGTSVGKTAHTGPDDTIGVAAFTHEIVNSTTLRVTRAVTGSATANVGWFVVEFNAWESYSDSGHTTVWGTVANPYDTDTQTAHIYGTGFIVSHGYHVGYYDNSGAKKASDGVTSGTDGSLSSQYLLTTDPTAEAGTWHAVVFDDDLGSLPNTYAECSGAAGYVVEDDFMVNQGAIPEFPTVFAGIGVAGLCFGIYYWMRKRRL